MGVVAGRYVDDIDRGVVEDLSVVGDCSLDSELLGHPFGQGAVHVHHGCHLYSGVTLPTRQVGPFGP